MLTFEEKHFPRLFRRWGRARPVRPMTR